MSAPSEAEISELDGWSDREQEGYHAGRTQGINHDDLLFAQFSATDGSLDLYVSERAWGASHKLACTMLHLGPAAGLYFEGRLLESRDFAEQSIATGKIEREDLERLRIHLDGHPLSLEQENEIWDDATCAAYAEDMQLTTYELEAEAEYGARLAAEAAEKSD